MSEKQTVSKFKDMVKNSLEVIKEFKEDEEITMSKTIVEIFTYVHAFKELTNLSESELENIVFEETGCGFDDLNDILNREEELSWI